MFSCSDGQHVQAITDPCRFAVLCLCGMCFSKISHWVQQSTRKPHLPLTETSRRTALMGALLWYFAKGHCSEDGIRGHHLLTDVFPLFLFSPHYNWRWKYPLLHFARPLLEARTAGGLALALWHLPNKTLQHKPSASMLTLTRQSGHHAQYSRNTLTYSPRLVWAHAWQPPPPLHPPYPTGLWLNPRTHSGLLPLRHQQCLGLVWSI